MSGVQRLAVKVNHGRHIGLDGCAGLRSKRLTLNVSAGSEQVTILKRMGLTTSRAETIVYSAMLNTSFYVVRSTRFNVGS